MKTLPECLEEAKQKGVAIGHFNISTLDAVWGIVRAAEKLNVPVIVGVSEGERDFVGVQAIAAIIGAIRKTAKVPVFLNADHTYSYERVVEAVDAGFDAVIIDGAQLPLKENIELTTKACAYAKKKNPNVLVEGELGYIGTSSKLLKELPKGVNVTGAGLTTPEDAKMFVESTGIDLFAPAVGNVHGMLVGMPEPRLDIGRIKEIADTVKTPLVLHGGSGTSNEDFVAAIEAGIRIVHINTEIRLAYTKALSLALQKDPEEVAPYKYLKVAAAALQKTVEERLALFNKISL